VTSAREAGLNFFRLTRYTPHLGLVPCTINPPQDIPFTARAGCAATRGFETWFAKPT
jgi:hypothetical protein